MRRRCHAADFRFQMLPLLPPLFSRVITPYDAYAMIRRRRRHYFFAIFAYFLDATPRFDCRRHADYATIYFRHAAACHDADASAASLRYASRRHCLRHALHYYYAITLPLIATLTPLPLMPAAAMIRHDDCCRCRYATMLLLTLPPPLIADVAAMI